MNENEIIKWLLEGDVSIQYQTYRDLLSIERDDLQKRIANEGWGADFLSRRKEDGHWGMKFYQPKWISSHYTLLDLKNLGIDPKHPLIRESVQRIVKEEKGHDGGINPAGSVRNSDVCINGMFLNYGCYFGVSPESLRSVVDFTLSQHMADGGFNCTLNRSGAVHSSLHTTISVLEGMLEYQRNGYTYRLRDLEKVKQSSIEFILLHQLFISDHSGEIINKNFIRLPYPTRWYYDILRALDYFQDSYTKWDDRMNPAIQVLMTKRRKDKRWNLQSKHPGQQHFEMEKAGKPGRWNTLRAMRVLNHFSVN